MKKLCPFYGLIGILLPAVIVGCSSMKPEADPYADTWQGVLTSPEWEKAMLVQPDTLRATRAAYFALPDWSDGSLARANPGFVDIYPKLVSRAYFRLISEAFRADRRIKMSYQDLYYQVHKPENRNDPILEKDFEAARTQYVAHRQMLDGLLSWHAFNTYGSDDLEFFMREQLGPSLRMYERGVKQDRILDRLITELADLYHQRAASTTEESL